MSKAQTDQLIEEALEKIDKKLKVFYKPGSFDVFNLRVAIEKELHLIASKSAERERHELVKAENFIKYLLNSVGGSITLMLDHSFEPENFEIVRQEIVGGLAEVISLEALSQPKETP